MSLLEKVTSSDIADGFITLAFHQSSGPAGTKNVDTADEGRLLHNRKSTTVSTYQLIFFDDKIHCVAE